MPIRGRRRLIPLFRKMFATDDVVEVELPGVGPVRLDLRDEDQLGMFWLGLHPDDARIGRLIRSVLPADGIFVDVGANIGLHTLTAARHLQPGGGCVVSFEPHPTNYATLRANLARQGLTCVVAENLAVSDAPGTLEVQGEERGNWSLGSRGDYRFSVRLTRLDDYLAASPLPRIDALKVDVEGAEPAVLRGAAEALRRFRPTLVFEVCPAWLRRLGSSVDDLLATVDRLGYASYRLPGNDGRSGDRVRVGDLAWMTNADWTNLVAVPAGPASSVRVESPAAAGVTP